MILAEPSAAMTVKVSKMVGAHGLALRSPLFDARVVELGLTIPGRSARQTSWVDYDNDGLLDVYAADRAGKNKLFHNDGNGKFT